MALIKLPPLPEGLHPYICIMKCESYESYSERKLYIITGDVPLIKMYYDSYGYKFNNICYFTFENNKWERQECNLKVNNNYIEVIYTNCDIKSGEEIIFEKTPDAVSVEIEGGNTRTLRKGMVWNVGEAINIFPVNAFQSATFESSNPSICTVDENGQIKAIGEGDCIITITTK